MMTDLAQNWWVLALRGALGILFGIGAFLWPGATLAALILVFGAYVFVDGIFAVVAGIGMRRQLRLWWLVLVEGVAGIVLGLLTFRSPDTTTLVLLTFIAAWSIVISPRATAASIRSNALGSRILPGKLNPTSGRRFEVMGVVNDKAELFRKRASEGVGVGVTAFFKVGVGVLVLPPMGPGPGYGCPKAVVCG